MIINFSSLGEGGGSSKLSASAFTDVVLNTSASTLDFYNINGDLVEQFDASSLIIDGMVEDVYLSGNTLVIDFNTESGQQDIEIDLTDFINPDLYYTSAQTDTLILNAKNDVYASATTYTDNAIALIDLSAAVASAKTYTDGEISAVTERLDDVEEVSSRALNDLNGRVNTLSASTSAITSGLTEKLDIAVFESSDLAVSQAINDLNNKKVASNDIHNIVKLTQAQYDALVTKDSATLYVIINE